jgi:hypothetical protein
MDICLLSIVFVCCHKNEWLIIKYQVGIALLYCAVPLSLYLSLMDNYYYYYYLSFFFFLLNILMNWTTASSLAHSIFVTHISSSNTMSLKFGSENVISIHFVCLGLRWICHFICV